MVVVVRHFFLTSRLFRTTDNVRGGACRDEGVVGLVVVVVDVDGVVDADGVVEEGAARRRSGARLRPLEAEQLPASRWRLR